jgi:hypothetical protein
MFAVKKSFELGVCLLGYWFGQGFGGWGGGIVLAFIGLFATSYGWTELESRLLVPKIASTPRLDFLYGAAATLAVLVVAYVNWNRTY